jgi:hypothetical protein
VDVGGFKADSYHSRTARTGSFDVNVPFMQLERHEWDIHAIRADGEARRYGTCD